MCNSIKYIIQRNRQEIIKHKIAQNTRHANGGGYRYFMLESIYIIEYDICKYVI